MSIERDTVIPPLPHTERGHGMHLGGTAKGKPRIVYGNSNLCIQREIEEQNNCLINPEHGVKCNVAKYSPNGEWLCSGDESGRCIVWANKSFVIKNEIMVGKCVLDIGWSGDQQKIFACGAGKDDKGKVFPWNSNNKLGDIVGANKNYTTCDFKPNRPFKCIAGSEDFGVYFYGGTPIKFISYDKTHKNYVNCTRFSPDGSVYISVGSDKQMLVFDGKEGTKLRSIEDADNGHKGSIYEISWSSDGKQFMTSSADRTCKVWDFESGKVIQTFCASDKPGVRDMQVTCSWIGDYMLSVSLSGRINYWKLGENRPIRVVTGHRKLIGDMTVDNTNGYVYTCDSDSCIIRTECKSGDCVDLIGDPHNGKQIKRIQMACDNKSFYTMAVDDTVFRHNTEDNSLELAPIDKGTKLDGACRAFAVGQLSPDLLVIGTHKQKLYIMKGTEIANTIEIDYTPTAAAISSDDKQLCVSGEDKSMRFYNLDDQKEAECIKSEFVREPIVKLSYSPDGQYLASADKNRHIWIWKSGEMSFEEPINKTQSFQFHNSNPTSLEWSKDSKQLLSAALDTNIYLWLAPSEGKSKNIHLDGAFNQGIVKTSFTGDGRIVGAGKDCTIRFFTIKQ